MARTGTFYVYPNGEVHELNFTPSNSDGKPVSRAEGKRLRQAYCCKELRKILKPGDTVYCILRSRSASGMSRRISLVVPVRDTTRKPAIYLRDITRLAGDALGWRINDEDTSLVIGGCGMDMGFHTVYELGHALWPKGTRKPHGTRNGEPDTAGGYALRKEWL